MCIDWRLEGREDEKNGLRELKSGPQAVEIMLLIGRQGVGARQL
jgi:hypothetical protein